MEENKGKENSIFKPADCYVYRVQRGLRAEITSCDSEELA